jgi:hypothetical protein
MVLHLPHAEGGFGVPFNCVTKDTVFYTSTSRFVTWLGAFPQERQELWLHYLKMTFTTRPHGHRPRLRFFETFTPRFWANTAAKRRLIGKLTDFLQLQEFSLRRHTQVFQYHDQPSV